MFASGETSSGLGGAAKPHPRVGPGPGPGPARARPGPWPGPGPGPGPTFWVLEKLTTIVKSYDYTKILRLY